MVSRAGPQCRPHPTARMAAMVGRLGRGDDPTAVHDIAAISAHIGDMITVSTITCPRCGHQAAEDMPTDACRFFYDCKGCGARLKPKAGDCCVFCSYGSVPCPPVQSQGRCNA